MKIRLGNLVAMATLVCLIAIAMSIFYWTFFDYVVRPVDAMRNPPYASLYPKGPEVGTFVAGKWMYINWDMRAIRGGCTATFTRRFISTRDFVVVPLLTHEGLFTAPRENTVWAVKIPIPDSMPIGAWNYSVKGVWRCNPFTAFVREYPPVQIEVTNGEGGG